MGIIDLCGTQIPIRLRLGVGRKIGEINVSVFLPVSGGGGGVGPHLAVTLRGSLGMETVLWGPGTPGQCSKGVT